jgi:hypothetical protein
MFRLRRRPSHTPAGPVNEYRSTHRTARDRAIFRCIRPLNNEMLASFLSNSARRNGLPAKTLTRLVAESGSSPMAVVTLLTGMSPSSLLAALPELREPAQPKAAERSSRHRHLGFDGFTVACAWCTARRGHRHSTPVSRHNPTPCVDDTAAGSAAHHVQRRQLDLSRHPDILAARPPNSIIGSSAVMAPRDRGVRIGHRPRPRLASLARIDLTYTHPPLRTQLSPISPLVQAATPPRCASSSTSPFIWAVTVVDDWQRRGVLSDVHDLARLPFRVEADVVLGTAPQVQAAQYPLSVRPTRLIVTPG